MSYGHRIEFCRQKTLALMAIVGKIYEGDEPSLLLQEAKKIAKEMAEELNMPEALEDFQVSARSIRSGPQNLATFVGRLAKTCEAFDHIEDFPYRKTLEENIRRILNL